MSTTELTQAGALYGSDVEIYSRSEPLVRRIRPQMNFTTAKKLVERLYRFTPTELTELEGYVDRNYFVNAPQDAECHSANGYVLKILNSEDTLTNHVEAQHGLMGVLIDQGFKCPWPVLNIYGQDKSIETIYYASENADGHHQRPDFNGKIIDRFPHGQHLVRLLNFVPGKSMGQVTYTPALLFSEGRFIAQFHKAVKDFSHPALDAYQFWNLDSIPDLKDYTYAISSPDNRALVNDVMQKFKKEILQKRHLFQKGVIHGDFNTNNIIVQESQTNEAHIDDPTYEIYGVIDFGYIAHSYYVYEIGISIMYAMLDSTIVEPLDVGGHILAGYLSEMQLNKVEIDSVMLCVAARFIQSLTMGAYNYTLEPGNEYILLTAKNGWKRLKELWSTPKSDIYVRWKRVISECYGIKQYPC